MRQITKKDIEAARCAASYLDQDIEPSIDEACDSQDESGWGEAPSQTTCRKAEAEAAERLMGWKAQARALWAKAYVAMESRNFSEMRNLASSAEDAENKSDLLVAAIFGVSAPTPALVALGGKVSVEDASAARAAVRKNIEAFEASKKKKPTKAEVAFAAKLQKMEKEEEEAFAVGKFVKAYNGVVLSPCEKYTRRISLDQLKEIPQLWEWEKVDVVITATKDQKVIVKLA